jgi:hypothetical protein
MNLPATSLFYVNRSEILWPSPAKNLEIGTFGLDLL